MHKAPKSLRTHHGRPITIGGNAFVLRYLPELTDQIWKGRVNPGNVFNILLPLAQAEGYRAMDRDGQSRQSCVRDQLKESRCPSHYGRSATHVVSFSGQQRRPPPVLAVRTC